VIDLSVLDHPRVGLLIVLLNLIPAEHVEVGRLVLEGRHGALAAPPSLERRCELLVRMRR